MSFNFKTLYGKNNGKELEKYKHLKWNGAF